MIKKLIHNIAIISAFLFALANFDKICLTLIYIGTILFTRTGDLYNFRYLPGTRYWFLSAGIILGFVSVRKAITSIFHPNNSSSDTFSIVYIFMISTTCVLFSWLTSPLNITETFIVPILTATGLYFSWKLTYSRLGM